MKMHSTGKDKYIVRFRRLILGFHALVVKAYLAMQGQDMGFDPYDASS